MSEPESLGELAVKYSRYYGGKVETIPKVPVRSLRDFAIWYTPGVAEVSRAIERNKEESFHLTNRWNTIAVITNGSRVLGLGNIGPEASLPVMEGKALIFKFLGGVDAFPLPVRAETPEKFIETVKTLEPAFGGFNLEDISSPECFYVLERLMAELQVPVWHDDQLGTAASTLAALISSLKLTGRSVKGSRVVLLGAGAANIATAFLLERYGFDPGDLILVDTKGVLHPERDDMDSLMLRNRWKYELAIKTNRSRVKGGLEEALIDADVLIAASKPGPGVVKKEHVKAMAKDPIVFALANPVPEIWPWEAKDAGAAIIATGRSDFPNQVNNSLVFPAVFRGALDVRSRGITYDTAIAAATELARCAEEKGLNENYIIPTMEEWEVFPRVAASVAKQLSDIKLARSPTSYEEELVRANEIVKRTRKVIEMMLEIRAIKPMPF
ncbi:MAG: NADP-dependent malic enzyme [Thaumarchaeota archaeon]|nr:NADP-dependent malic enzyme [Candidatus Calditenuaceae archaeon]MDW8187606.1 NADP-dependent malic enzyme [Nitrososphaerota archaeon]